MTAGISPNVFPLNDIFKENTQTSRRIRNEMW